MNNVENQNNVNVDSGLKALDVPRLDRASEVLPQAVGEATGLDNGVDPVDSLICCAIQVLQKARLGVVHRRLKELGLDPLCQIEGN